MKTGTQFKLVLQTVLFIYISAASGTESQLIDQKQLEWFGVSTLKNVREVYPQVGLEIVEKNMTESNFTPQIGPLTKKDLQKHLEQLLQKSGIKTTNKFNATSAKAPLSLNVTVFARVQNDTPMPSYAVFVYTEAMQPGMLIRDNKIRSFSRTWPMVPTGDGARALLFLTPETIAEEITREVTRQVRNFIIDFSNANPDRKITVPVIEKPVSEPVQDKQNERITEPVSPNPGQKTI